MKFKVFGIALLTLFLVNCGGEAKKEKVEKPAEAAQPEVVDPMKDKGIGPITSMTLGEIDADMAAEGKDIFTLKCSACHKITKRFVGPPLEGVTTRRTPEWIMNMILNPEEMVAKNALAKQLLGEYLSPMANQNLTEDEARKILEYFRTKTGESSEE
jgi:mono/diheme cytochrome c family protein